MSRRLSVPAVCGAGVAGLVLLVPLAHPAAGGSFTITKVASVDVGGSARGIVFRENLAYVATYTGLAILDVSQPEAPRTVGSLRLARQVVSLAVLGNRAYLASRACQVTVADVSDPKAPRAVSRIHLAHDPWDVAVKDDVLYVLNMFNKIYVLDASRPDSLKVIKEMMVKNDGETTGILVDGNRMIVSGLEPPSGMFVYDVTNAADPVFRGWCPAPPILQTALVPGATAMFGLGWRGSGVHRGDLANLSPEVQKEGASEAKGFQGAGGYFGKGGMGISEDGRYLFAVSGDDGAMRVVDVSDPGRMEVVAGPIRLGPNDNLPKEILKVVVRGNRVYACGGKSGLHILRFAEDGAQAARRAAR